MEETKVDFTPEEKREILFGKAAGTNLLDNKLKSEKTEEAEETKTDTTEKTKESTEKVEKSELDFSVFSKFGKNIEKEEDIKSLFEKADKYDETQKSYDELTQKLSEYQTIAEKVDPLSHFLNEDRYKAEQLLIKHKDSLSDDAVKALSVLTPNKVKEMSDKDVIRTKLLIDEGLTGEEADAYLNRKYGVDDFSDEDIDVGVRAEIKVDAKNARKSVLGLYDGISLPTKVDFETARTQLKESWSEPLPELIKGIDKIQLAEDLDFVVTEDMKKGLEESTMSWLLSKQIKPSEDAGAVIVGQLREKILLDNFDKVINSIKTDLEEKFKAQTRAKIHNDKPLDEGDTKTEVVESNSDKFRRLL